MASEILGNILMEYSDKGAILDKLLCWMSANEAMDKITLKDTILRAFSDEEVTNAKEAIKKKT